MNINDIDIDNIKVAIFDFDDTLAIHKDKDFVIHRNENEEKRLGYYINSYLNPNNFYDDIEPCSRSELLYNFIDRLRNNSVKIYCLSGMKFSFHLNAKQNFINKYYGNDIEVITAGTQELKIDGVKILQKINKCELNEILFIDDRKDVIELMNSNGVNAMLVTELKEK